MGNDRLAKKIHTTVSQLPISISAGILSHDNIAHAPRGPLLVRKLPSLLCPSCLFLRSISAATVWRLFLSQARRWSLWPKWPPIPAFSASVAQKRNKLFLSFAWSRLKKIYDYFGCVFWEKTIFLDFFFRMLGTLNHDEMYIGFIVGRLVVETVYLTDMGLLYSDPIGVLG